MYQIHLGIHVFQQNRSKGVVIYYKSYGWEFGVRDAVKKTSTSLTACNPPPINTTLTAKKTPPPKKNPPCRTPLECARTMNFTCSIKLVNLRLQKKLQHRIFKKSITSTPLFQVKKNLCPHQIPELMVMLFNWEVNCYAFYLKIYSSLHKETDLVLKRAEIEKHYADSLRQWAKQFKQSLASDNRKYLVFPLQTHLGWNRVLITFQTGPCYTGYTFYN